MEERCQAAEKEEKLDGVSSVARSGRAPAGGSGPGPSPWFQICMAVRTSAATQPLPPSPPPSPKCVSSTPPTPPASPPAVLEGSSSHSASLLLVSLWVNGYDFTGVESGCCQNAVATATTAGKLHFLSSLASQRVSMKCVSSFSFHTTLITLACYIVA